MAAAEAEGAGETEEEIEEEEETEEPEIRHKKFRKRHREDEADISSSVISEKPVCCNFISTSFVENDNEISSFFFIHVRYM